VIAPPPLPSPALVADEARAAEDAICYDGPVVPVVYSHRYNITAFGLERLHPIDSRKYRRIHDWLIQQGLRKAGDFVAPSPVSRGDLLRVHAADYLRSLRRSRVLARILEVPPVAYLPAWLVNWRSTSVPASRRTSSCGPWSAGSGRRGREPRSRPRW
jgi:acetoin utilization deacetylase AcuC-like enzyme